MLWKSWSDDRHDQPTRERVVRSVLSNGPSTAAALAERLELTPAAVRRHLDQLIDEGILEAREPRAAAVRGRGRPAKVFVLTDAGRDSFDQAYDDLAVQAIRFLAETGGDDAVRQFADRRAAKIEQRFEAARRGQPRAEPRRGARPGLHRRGLRRRAARRARGGAAVPAALPGLPRRPRVPRAVRGRDGRDQPDARPPRAATRDHRPRRRRVHHLHPRHGTSRLDQPKPRRRSPDDFHRRAEPPRSRASAATSSAGPTRPTPAPTRRAVSTRTSCATSPRRRASRSGCSTCA